MDSLVLRLDLCHIKLQFHCTDLRWGCTQVRACLQNQHLCTYKLLNAPAWSPGQVGSSNTRRIQPNDLVMDKETDERHQKGNIMLRRRDGCSVHANKIAVDRGCLYVIQRIHCINTKFAMKDKIAKHESNLSHRKERARPMKGTH